MASVSFLIQLLGALVSQNVFYWQIMSAVPGIDPDVAALYTFDFFMPLANLSEVLRGGLNVAWKTGPDWSLESAGLLFVVSGLLIGIVGLRLAWRGERTSRVAACVSPLLVIGVAFSSLVYYNANGINPYRALVT